MIRLFRFACMSGLGGTTITIAVTQRCHSATRRHRDARHSVSSIPTMWAQQGRRGATGVTAEPIELIERPADMLTRATGARKEVDRPGCGAWNKRMLGFQGPAQALADAGCHSAWGPSADRHSKYLIDFTTAGSTLEAYSQWRWSMPGRSTFPGRVRAWRRPAGSR